MGMEASFVAGFAWEWKQMEYETQLSLTNRPTHMLCSMHGVAAPKHASPHTCYHPLNLVALRQTVG